MSTQPKPLDPIKAPSPAKAPDHDDPLGNLKIINPTKQNCAKLACQKIKEINDVTNANDRRPLIEINSNFLFTARETHVGHKLIIKLKKYRPSATPNYVFVYFNFSTLTAKAILSLIF